MKILCQEFKKIWRQMLGTENIFGFKSTVANQLYLLYCFSGHIYFTDKVHKQVKYIWCGLVSCQILFSYIFGLSYLWYDEKNDLVKMLYTANSFGAIHMATLGFPLLSHLFGDRVQAMIKFVDSFSNIQSSSTFDQNTVLEDVKKYFLIFTTPLITSALVYMFGCVPDVVLFFEEDKVRDYFYYPYPPPMVQKCSSLTSFMIMGSATSMLFLLMLFEFYSVFGFMLYWNIICCNQLIVVKNELNARTVRLNEYSDHEVKSLREWNGIFKRTLERSITGLQLATRLTNELREFFEAIVTIIAITAFGYGVALLYFCFSNDMSLMLKMKCLMGYMENCIVVFLFYWIGQRVDNSISEVSLAVYSTPWYRSVKMRKTVHILLCQTQSMKNFAISKVHALLLNNFSRYLHSLLSYTSSLHRLANK
ncbi:uncharacterized protein LOC135846790 [Planococcus citri]|uniref:uncharacterized protein LOC135846790 n=1 Tax=Planococcus citri TaxID=170843 RepID=UPI0031F7A392